MENTINPACSSDAIKILLSIALTALLLWLLYHFFRTIKNQPSETFKQHAKTITNSPSINEQVITGPASYNKETGSIQSGSKFIQQKQYFTPWGTIIQPNYSKDGNQTYSEEQVTDYTLGLNQCSPACCSDQWPVPFKISINNTFCENEEDYVPNTYYCNNRLQDSGCLCMTKQQSNFLQTRGFNTDNQISNN